MVTIINTGDRESDLYHHDLLRKVNTTLAHASSIDGSTTEGQHQFLMKLETISLLSEPIPLVVHAIELTDQTAQLLKSYAQDVVIVSPAGKLPKLDQAFKQITAKVADATLKSLLDEKLRKLHIQVSRDTLIRIYMALTIEDVMGKERLSPLKYLTFERQLESISSDSPDETSKLLESVLGIAEGKASQWEMLTHLFSSQKKTQKQYFAALAETMSPYEIMSMAKSTILLVMAIILGQKEHLDQASIATKLGKHPFYIGSLARSIQNSNITYDRALKVVTRLLNLESMLKSGKFDDEYFGFEVLLATL